MTSDARPRPRRHRLERIPSGVFLLLSVVGCGDRTDAAFDPLPPGTAVQLRAWTGSDSVPLQVSFRRNLSPGEADSLLPEGTVVEVVYSSLFGRNGTIPVPAGERENPSRAFEAARVNALAAADPRGPHVECVHLLREHREEDLSTDARLLERVVWTAAWHSSVIKARTLLLDHGAFVAGVAAIVPGVEAAARIARSPVVRQFEVARRRAGEFVPSDIDPLPSTELDSRILADNTTPSGAWDALVACAARAPERGTR